MAHETEVLLQRSYGPAERDSLMDAIAEEASNVNDEFPLAVVRFDYLIARMFNAFAFAEFLRAWAWAQPNQGIDHLVISEDMLALLSGTLNREPGFDPERIISDARVLAALTPLQTEDSRGNLALTRAMLEHVRSYSQKAGFQVYVRVMEG